MIIGRDESSPDSKPVIAFVESCREQDVPLPAADDTLIISVSQTQTSYTSATPTSIPMTSPSTMALTEISSTSAQTDAAASSTTPTAASQTSQLGSTASHSSSNIPAIIGGVIGGATFVVILLLLWFCLRRRQRQKELEEGTNQRRVQLEPSPEVPTPWSYPEAGEMTPWQPQMAQIPSPSPDVHSSLFQSSVPLPDTSVITEASPHSPPLNERYSLITDASGRGQSATATTELGSSQKQRPEEAPSQSGRSDVLSENDVDRIAARLAGYMGSRIVPEDVAGAEAPPSYLG